MNTKVFTQFRAPVNSYPLGEMNVGPLAPGRYSGFDIMTGTTLSINIGHSNRIKKSSPSVGGVISEIVFGALLMPNGCTIHVEDTGESDGLDFNIDSNTGNANPRYDLVVCEHEYIQTAGGVAPLFFIQKGANDGLVPALAIPKKQVIIGIIKSEPNGNSFAQLTYTKSAVPNLGDSTIQEILNVLGIPTMFNEFGLQDAITNDPIITEDSIIQVAETKTLDVTKPQTGSTDANFYGTFGMAHLATQVVDTLKAWFGIKSVTNGNSWFKFLIGSTVFEDTANSKGLKYAGDYEANFEARSLVTKQYVDLKAGSTIKSVTVFTSGISINSTYSIATGLAAPDATAIIAVIPYVECVNANNGFAPGTIATPGTPTTSDSGGLSDSGVGAQFIASELNLVRVAVNNRIDINAANYNGVGSTGGIADPFVISANTGDWKLRVLVLYI